MEGNVRAALALMRAAFRRHRLSAAGFWTWSVSVGLYQLLGLAFVWVASSRLSAGAEWLAIYVYGVFQGATGLAYAFGAWTVFFASRYVRRGELDALLLLVPDPRVSLPFANLEPVELAGALSGYALALIGLRASARLTEVSAAITLAGIACGGAATYSLFMAAATLSLCTKQSSAAISFAIDLVLFGQYPMNLYPSAMRTLLTWILPIVLIANAPACLVDAGPGLLAAVLAAAALALVGANALFKHALGRFIRHW
mgnify:CR=1 FL=1